MEEVARDLEGILEGHLKTLRAAVETGQQHRVDADKVLARAAKKLDPEPDEGSGLMGIAALDAMGESAEDHEEPQTPEHWRQLCEAVVVQLGQGAGELMDLATGDVLDLGKPGAQEQAAGRLLLGKHIKAVIGEVVNEGVDFINQRNAAQQHSAQQSDGQETGDLQPAEGTAGLIAKLPPLLTTPAVNNVCETLLSEAMKEQLVGKVKQAAGQALTAGDKGKATTDTPVAGPLAEGAAAGKHTAVGSAVDPVLRKELSELLRTGADQLTDFLKTTPYETVKGMGQDLPLQGLGDGVKWLSELVTDLFNPDKDKARSRLTAVLTGRVVKAQDEVIDHVLRRLAGEGVQAGEGETETKTTRDKLLDMVADQVPPLVAPALSGAAVEVTRSTGQPLDPQALSKVIEPFLSEQLEQGKAREERQGQDHWRQLCEAVVGELGQGAGELMDLATGDVLDLGKPGAQEQAAGRLLLGKHIKAVIGEVVNEGAGFIAQRNAAQRNAAHNNGNGQPAEGKAELIDKLPPFLTTPAVNSVCETLLSATIKEQLIGTVKQAAGQALAAGDKGKATTDTPLAGPSAEDAAAVKHTAVGSAVDQVLRKELAGMLRTGSDQLAELLKTTPYETVKEMGRKLPLQGLGDGVEWLSELVKDLFNPEPGKLDQGEVFKRLSGYGVDQLTAWVRDHKDTIQQDVKTQTRALMADVAKDLEGILDGHLETLRTAVTNGQRDKVGVVKVLEDAAEELDPELSGLAAIEAMNEKTKAREERQGQDHWRQLCEAVVGELGQGAGELMDLATGDVLDLGKPGAQELAAGRLLLGKHIKAVIGEVVNEGAGFIAQRNAAHNNGNGQPAEGKAELIEKLPPLLTTPAVNNVCETLLSEAMKEQLVGKVKQAAGQALAAGDKGKATTDTPLAGPSAEDAAAVKHTAVGSAVDQVLRKELAGMLRTGSDQLAELLKTTPYETVKEMGRKLPLQGLGDGVEWLSELVKDLFNPEPVKVRSRVIESLTGQVVNAQEEVIDRVLDWLAAEAPDTGEGEPAAVANRDKLLNIVVDR
ncbi:hypothetical protein CAPTEDRAFT_191567, partial [Capitella teleta]